MNKTPASNETKLGILDHDELNQHEAVGLKKTWDYLVNHQEAALDTLLLSKHIKQVLIPYIAGLVNIELLHR